MPAACPYSESARSNPHPNFLKIHLNIIVPFTPGSPNWSLFLRFPYQFHVYTSLLPYIYCVLLTPYSRVLLEKLTGSQLVKKLPAFYVTRRFITSFTSARYLSLYWASSFQSIPLHPTSWRSILILSSHLRLGLPSGLFPSGFPPEPSIRLSSPLCALHDSPISVLSILSPKQHWVRSTDH